MRVTGMAVKLSFLILTLTLLFKPMSHANAQSMIDDFKRAHAQGKTMHVLEIDNDSLLLQRDDGFYSSLVRYSQHYTLSEAGVATTFGWRVGHEIYTASNVRLQPEQIGLLDHPYAAWLYGGLFKQRQYADGRMQKIGLDVGCIGPCAAGEWVQTTLHRALNQDLPQAWSTQVKNGVGIVLYGEMAPIRWTPRSWLDVTPSLQGRFGTIFTDASAGLTLRTGNLNKLANQASLHGFVRTDVRAVAYNASLQGAYFSSPSPRTVEPKPWVGEAEIGVLWQRTPFSLKASIVGRSNEIRDLPNAIGAQNFARFQLSYTP